MATLPPLQKQVSPTVISDTNALDAFTDVSGGVIDTFNDSTQQPRGKFFLPLFVKKLEGYSIINSITGVNTPTLGAAMWVDPDTSASNRFHKLWAVGDKIHLTDTTGTVELRDVSSDGFSITRLVGVMAKNNLYIVIGDATMDAKVYKYIGANTGVSICTDFGGGEINVASVGHGLVTGMTITNAGTTDYNGTFVVTFIDADNFKFTDTYVNDQTGTWTVSKQIELQTMTQMRAASMIMYWAQRLGVTGIGSDQALAQYSVLDIAGNFTDFTVGTETTAGGDFFGNLPGITCMIEHDGYGILFSATNVTVHKFGVPISAGASFVKDPDTIQENLTVSGNGTQSPFGAVSARGAIYYVDPSAGIFELKISTTVSGFSKALKDLTERWKSEFLKYDSTDACVTYDSVMDLLLISGISTIEGERSNVTLVYSFRTGRWSQDLGKRSRQIIASPEEKKLYGFGSIDPEIQDFFDGSFNDNGKAKKVIAWTRMYDGGRRSLFKEHESTTQIIGIHPNTTDVLFEFLNRAGVILTSTTLDLSDLASSSTVSAPGEWGDYVWGRGSFLVENPFVFKQYFNDDAIDDFQDISVRLTEESSNPILFFVPEILAILSTDFAEDIV